MRSLAAYGEVFARNVKASGVIPQISVIMGPCAGGAVYSPALTDFTIMVDGTSAMFLTGPGVVASVTGEKVSSQELGGSDVHNTRSGNAHFRTRSDTEALALVQRILGYLPSNTQEDAPVLPSDDPIDRSDDELNVAVPSDGQSAYSMRKVLETIFDRDSLLEVHREFAPNAIVAFARLGGRSVGIVANEPSFMSGVLDINSSDKISRFVRLCDAFFLPVVTFVDCPGYLPGVDQEYNGVIRHGAKIIYAYCECSAPKISVVTRKAIGGSYVALGSRQMGADVTLAWPTAQIAVMGPRAPHPWSMVAKFVRRPTKMRNVSGSSRNTGNGSSTRTVQPTSARSMRSSSLARHDFNWHRPSICYGQRSSALFPRNTVCFQCEETNHGEFRMELGDDPPWHGHRLHHAHSAHVSSRWYWSIGCPCHRTPATSRDRGGV